MSFRTPSVWWILAIPGGLFAGVVLWTRTLGLWLGSTVDLNGLAHWNPILMLPLFAAYFLLVGWFAVAAVVAVSNKRWRQRLPVWKSVVGIFFLVLASAPPAFVEAPFVLVFGGGRSSAEFLRIAAEARSRMLVRALLYRGADINQPASTKDAAIGQAACENDADFVSWLIDRGADPNVKGSLGYSALTCAVGNGHVAVVRVLLARGADPRSVTENGRSVLDIAIEAGHPEVIGVVQSALTKR